MPLAMQLLHSSYSFIHEIFASDLKAFREMINLLMFLQALKHIRLHNGA